MKLNRGTDKNRSGFFIGVGCPGCGGELALEQDFFVLECTHCGSVLRVTMPETPPAFLAPARMDERQARVRIDRHLKELRQPLTRNGLHFKRLYYPYWKVDAIMLKVRNHIEKRTYVNITSEGTNESTVENPKTDINLSPYMTTIPAGANQEGIPSTIGLRAQYLRLLPYSRENTQDDFDSVSIVRGWTEVREDLVRRAGAIGSVDTADFGRNQTELFRPKAALVYFPYLIAETYHGGDYRRFVVDGISGRVVNHAEEWSIGEIDTAAELPTIEFGQLQVGFHRCSECGIDLPPTQSYVYVCANCEQTNLLGGIEQSVASLEMAADSDDSDGPYFPFWAFAIPPRLQPRLKRLFGGLHDSDQLVIPAFRTTAFDGLYRLTKRVSAALPNVATVPLTGFKDQLRPASLHPEEARLLADVIVRRAELDHQSSQDADDIDFHQVTCRLIYLPFRAETYFYVDSLMHSVTFEKKLID